MAEPGKGDKGYTPGVAPQLQGCGRLYTRTDSSSQTSGGGWAWASTLEPLDRQGPDLTRDDILDNITLYWLTNTAVSSARLYWENKQPASCLRQRSIITSQTAAQNGL